MTRNGVDYNVEDQDELFNMVFYMSEFITDHQSMIYTFSMFLSEVGGFLASFMAIISLFARPMNRLFLLNKIKRAIYYIKTLKGKSKHRTSHLDTEYDA